MRIQCRKLSAGTDGQPVFQVLRLPVVQRIQEQHRKSEIIHVISVLLNFDRHCIVLVNFRKHHTAKGTHNILCILQHIPDFGFYKEAGGSCLFRGISDRIHAHDGNPMFAQRLQVLLHKAFPAITLQIQIDLLFAKGAPDFFPGTVRKRCVHVRSSGLSLIDSIHLFLRGLAVFPEILVTDEQVLIFGLILFLQKILIIFAVRRDVIDHEITHQVIAL